LKHAIEGALMALSLHMLHQAGLDQMNRQRTSEFNPEQATVLYDLSRRECGDHQPMHE